MEKNELYSYVYDFVSRLIERVSDGSVRNIIVFGSVERGDFDKESDIDIFIDTSKEKEVSGIVKSALNEFYSHSRHTWLLRGIENEIKTIVGSLEDERWSSLKREIISNGSVIYGKYKELPMKLKPYAMLTYNISKLKPKEKAKFSRDLLGYRLLRKKKEYRTKGLLENLGGRKISKNVIIAPKENQKKIYDFISKSKAKFEIIEIWVEHNVRP